MNEYIRIWVTDFLPDNDSINFLYVNRLHKTKYYKIKKMINYNNIRLHYYKVQHIYYDNDNICNLSNLPLTLTYCNFIFFIYNLFNPFYINLNNKYYCILIF